MMISKRTWNLNCFVTILIKDKIKFALIKFTKFVCQVFSTVGICGKAVHIKIILVVLLVSGRIMIIKTEVTVNKLVKNYCKTSACTTIECAYIPASLDAGTEVSRFIMNEFKVQCPDATKIQFLNFHNCNFCGNKLGPLWLSSDIPVEEICFRDTHLNEITDDAFAQSIFFNLKSLSIMYSNISIWKRTIFRRMSNLRTFLIHDNLVRYAESDLLQYVASTLEVLELDRSISNLEVLNNITGKGSLLNVQILSIQGNSLYHLSSDTFKGVANVQSLYIDKSDISSMSVNIFQPLQLISQLFLRSNKLTKLAEGILDPILIRGDNKFRLALTNNPWHCDCNLFWLKNIMNTYPNMFIDNPICISPENVAYEQIKTAELCTIGSNETITTEKSKTSTESSMYPQNTVNVSCKYLFPALKYRVSRRLLSADYQFRGKIRGFFVQELNNGSIYVNLVNVYETSLTLLWFDNDELISANQDESSVIHCVKNIHGSFVLDNVREDVTYTICILESPDSSLSPLNCLALTTNPNYKSRPWISNGEKSITIGAVVLILISLCVCSGFLAFLVVRRHPNLLRGSKRVIIVRRREISAVVLPEGIRLSPCTDRNTLRSEEGDYITPLEGYGKRKDSQMSRTSSHSSDISYISGIEPNLLQLISWRHSRAKYETPPPLPPHPLRIPSISKGVDTRHNNPNFDVDVKDVAKL